VFGPVKIPKPSLVFVSLARAFLLSGTTHGSPKPTSKILDYIHLRKNTLAYFSRESTTKKNKLSHLDNRCQCDWTSFSLLIKRPNKLERLSLSNTSSLVLCFRVKQELTQVEHLQMVSSREGSSFMLASMVRAYPSGTACRYYRQQWLLTLPANIRQGWKKFIRPFRRWRRKKKALCDAERRTVQARLFPSREKNRIELFSKTVR
jgi:hypothetical protein